MDDQPITAGECTEPVQLAGRDSWFVYSELTDRQHSPDVITTVYVFDTRHDPHPIRTHASAASWMRDRLDRAEVLRRRLVRVPGDLDHPYWSFAPDVDLDHHIRVQRIGETSWRALSDHLAETTKQPVDLAHNPWELHLLTEIRGVAGIPDDATLVVLRFHHCATDGLGAVQVARALFDDPEAVSCLEGRRGPIRGPVSSLLRLPAQFIGLGRSLVRSAAARRDLTALVESGALSTPRHRRPRTRFNGNQSGQRTFGRAKFALSDVREVARATGTSVNDVVLAIVGGGLGAYLGGLGEAPDGALAAQVPRSIRDRSHVAASNKITTMFVDLHTDEPTPIERLRRIHDSAIAEKARVQHQSAIDIESPIDHAPAIYLRIALRLSQRKSAAAARSTESTVTWANTLVTSMPRGAADLMFGGSPVVDGFYVPPIHPGAGLSHSVVSIGDVLSVEFTSDAAMMRDPDAYAHLLEAAFDELRALPEE
ncbi:wax ester/triacylglycerol synthase domain-containing protein [Rhodococcus sp. NPDC003322]